MAELAIRGGTPVRPQGYPAWPVWDDAEIQAVTEVVRSGNWGGFPEPGPKAQEFETAFAAYPGGGGGAAGKGLCQRFLRRAGLVRQ